MTKPISLANTCGSAIKLPIDAGVVLALLNA
jgi:hypothetical protein